MSGNWKVYEHRNKINNKSYIGITSTSVYRRWGHNGRCYKGSPKFWNAIQKYGWNNFEHNVLADNLTEEEACNLEILLIKKMNTIINGYNQEPGGIGGSRSVETRQKIREARMRQIMTRETIDKIASAHRGMKRSEITRNRIKESRKDMYHAVKCIETEEVFDSITKAAETKHVSISSITKSCQRFEDNTKTRNRGFHWCYVKTN